MKSTLSNGTKTSGVVRELKNLNFSINKASSEGAKKLAVVYARVASLEQEPKGYSIPAQLKLLYAYAERNGFKVVEEFVDVQAAKDPGRTNFDAMVQQLRRSKNCRTILVEKVDRLARNYEEMALLKQLDVEIHFAKAGTVYPNETKAQTKFMKNIEFATATYYSDSLRAAIIKGTRQKAEQGSYPGRAPFGYQNNGETRNIEPHPTNAPIAQRAYELFAAGKYTLNTLGKKLREEFGKAPTRPRLHEMLKNTAYTGIFRWGGTSYQGNYQPLVSRELFDAVQAALSR
jgi:site-specific DNA recombinase